MSDDKTKDLEKKLAALPPVPRAFAEGYGEGVGGYDPGQTKAYAEGRTVLLPTEGYVHDLHAATHQVCQRCGAVVSDTDLHDGFHDRVDSKAPSTIESEVDG